MIRLDAREGRLDALIEPGEWDRRSDQPADLSGHARGVGRELFAGFRRDVGPADQGALAIGVLTAP